LRRRILGMRLAAVKSFNNLLLQLVSLRGILRLGHTPGQVPSSSGLRGRFSAVRRANSSTLVCSAAGKRFISSMISPAVMLLG
jgi:hypothetical protein